MKTTNFNETILKAMKDGNYEEANRLFKMLCEYIRDVTTNGSENSKNVKALNQLARRGAGNFVSGYAENFEIVEGQLTYVGNKSALTKIRNRMVAGHLATASYRTHTIDERYCELAETTMEELEAYRASLVVEENETTEVKETANNVIPTVVGAETPIITATDASPTYTRIEEEPQVIGYVQGLYGDALDVAILHLKNAGVDIIFHERRAFESTKLTYRAFTDYVRKGDEVIVYQLVNFAKNVVYLEQEVSKVVGVGATFRSISEPWFYLTSDTSNDVWAVLHGLATMEKQGRAELQKYSLAKTQKAGHNEKSGRKLEIEAIENAIHDYLNNEDDIPVAHIAKKHGISRATLYRYLKDRNLYKAKC